MKNKIISLMLIMIMLAVCVTGCGNESSVDTSKDIEQKQTIEVSKEKVATNESKSEAISEVASSEADTKTVELKDDDFEITVNGAVIKIGGDMVENKAVMGEPTDFSSAKSCMTDGDDKIFTYDDATIYTHPVDGKDVIYLVELYGSYELKSGITFGSTLEEVEAYYGKAKDVQGTEYYYSSNGLLLGIEIRNDVVSFIEITED